MQIKILTRSILIASIIFVAAAFAQAAEPAPAGEPNPASNPMLAEFIRSGAKIYYLGTRSGLPGWFITKDGQVQIGYATPDNQSLLIGVLLDGNGNSVTSEQMKSLYDNNKDVKAFFDSMNNQSALPGGVQIQNGQMTNSTNTNAASLLAGNNSPSERLMQAFQNAAGVDVGAASAPKLYMVIDPNCPHCHKTWQELRTAVFGGKIQIRLVPIDAQNNDDSARAAAQLLHVANPLNAWDKYIDGDKSQLAGNPDDNSLKAIRANAMLIDAWHITVTPYMLYRAKDGQAKIVQGEPEQAAAIINDIGP